MAGGLFLEWRGPGSGSLGSAVAGGRKASGGLSGLSRILDKEARDLERAIEKGVDEASLNLRDTLRQQTSRAYDSRKLGSNWSRKLYGKGAKRAGFVYARAAKIMALGATGDTVKPKRGRYLWIPTQAAKRTRPARTAAQAGRSKRRTPAQFIGGLGVFFIPPKGSRPAMIVKKTKRTPFRVLFFGVSSTRHRKRLDIQSPRRKAADELPAAVLKHMPG